MPSIDLCDIDLVYPATSGPRWTLKDLFVQALSGRSAPPRMVTALTQVSLHIADGERVGIIGANGAGKSTLLRTIAGVFPIDAGSRMVSGRIASLFDVQAGLDLEADGWKNIRLRGYLQGETPAALAAKTAEIAEFSELGDFLDLPVKTYSTGMVMRLAFSIATASAPEILLVDEVFGAGDLAFQRKAQERMQRLMDRAKIVVVVGHDLSFIESFCDRAVWLERGRVERDGSATAVVGAYRRSASQRTAAA